MPLPLSGRLGHEPFVYFLRVLLAAALLYCLFFFALSTKGWEILATKHYWSRGGYYGGYAQQLAETSSGYRTIQREGLANLANLWPLDVPTVKFIDPGTVDADSRILFTSTIPPGESWRYRFALTDLESRERECGSFVGTVYIDGIRLADATVEIQPAGTSWLTAPKYLKAYSLDEIQLVPDLRGVRAFDVTLTPKPGATPAIRQAPEADGFTIYHDAVFLELKNDKCTILYHVVRRVETAGEPQRSRLPS